MKYRIGDTVIAINVEEEELHPNFQAFVCEEDALPQLSLEVVQETQMMMSVEMTVGQIVLMKSDRLGVYEGAMGIDLVYRKHTQLTSISVEKGYQNARIYVVKDDDGVWKEELHEALKDVIYLALEQNGRVVLDSSSLLIDGRGVIFAADPGAAFAKLCIEQDLGKMLNDQANVLGIQEGRIYLYGTPWCGEENFQAERTPLGGIVFLQKSDAMIVSDVQADKRQLLLLIYCKSPLWREGLLDQCLDTIQRVEPSVWIRQLKSHSDAEAVGVLKEALDSMDADTTVQY